MIQKNRIHTEKQSLVNPTCIVPLYWHLSGVHQSGRPGPHKANLCHKC